MIEFIRNIQKSKEVADLLEQEKENILRKWEADEFVQTVLGGHHIEPAFFVNHFGARVLEYFLGVLRGEKEVGQCPAITALLMFFRQKNILLNEVFLCCAAFKNIVVRTCAEKRKEISEEEYRLITKLFDLNFAGVIHEFLQKRFCNINCTREELVATQSVALQPETAVTSKDEENKKIDVFTSEYEREDIDEFIDIEDDIIAISDQLNFGVFEPATIEAMADKLSKYGSIILTNYNFNRIGNSVMELSSQLNEENYPYISDNIASLALFINCFINDLILWRKSLLETGIEDPHYFDQSIVSNVEQIIQMIQGEEHMDEGEGFEFF